MSPAGQALKRESCNGFSVQLLYAQRRKPSKFAAIVYQPINTPSAGGENVEVSVTFSAVTQYGYGVRKYAQKVLDSLNLSGVNPNLAPAFASDIDAEVQHGNGYAQQIKEANSSFLKP